MNSEKKWLFICEFIFLCGICTGFCEVVEQSIIADHNSVAQFVQIPDYWLDNDVVNVIGKILATKV
jgi:hypothetical protein